jgi:hypothetical protein
METIWCLHGFLQSGEIIQEWNISDKDLVTSPAAEDIQKCLQYGRDYRERYGNPSIILGFFQGGTCATIITPRKVILLSIPCYRNCSKINLTKNIRSMNINGVMSFLPIKKTRETINDFQRISLKIN